ncbi:MAG: hypothetical protein NVSMB38_39520 [Ktedonobacteraceae bacterium]
MVDHVGQQFGNYRLLRLLGRGSFAEVYLAEHLYLERPAAIKVLHVQMEPQTQEQFRREACTIAHLQHPHILQVFDFGIHDQTPFLVMEYTPGGTLRTPHPKGTSLPLEQIVIYVKQIASALDYAHQHRVIHRDVKPDNLLLSAKDEVVLSDFGIAVLQRTLNSLSIPKPAGTPLYMAPEQIQHQSCPASDQYALGVMVYEWLVGEPPFRGTLYEVFSHHLYQPPPSLRERLSDLPVAVEEAVFKTLAKDPDHRFACVVDFAVALEDACVTTQPLSLHEQNGQRTQMQLFPHKTLLVSALPARDQEHASFLTQPILMNTHRTEPKPTLAPMIAPEPALQRPLDSKQTKPSLAQNNRQRFLKKVRTSWIEGVLEHSLYGTALIALGLQEQLDALANPWHLVLHHSDTAPRSFPLGTRITEVYDAANGELLILGAPGSGKTTLLLELTRALLDRAEQDEQHLMPVVFPLSSWAAKQQSLTEWMLDELMNKYQVPRKLARTWVEADQILPLLDGLDEVAPQNRTACIQTINTYHQEHSFLPLVIASRSTDYLAQTARIRLSRAITIQPLTQKQVEEYVARGGEALWPLQVALHQDTALRELTETPLMLSILTLTYNNMPLEELLQGGITHARHQIFERYVERMLVTRGDKEQYPPEQTRGWLMWLAQQMRCHNQTVFFIEQMQPEWLRAGKQEHRFSFRHVGSIVMRIIVGLLHGVVIGSLLGLTTGVLSGLVSVALNGVLFNSSIGGWNFVVRSGISGILIAVVIVGLIGGLASGLKREIHLVEVIAWSWKRMQQQWRYWLFGMLVGGLIFGLLSVESVRTGTGTYSISLLSKLIIGLSGGLFGSLIGSLLGGISFNKLDAQTRVRPNQGVWRSLQNSLLIGGLSGIIVILMIATLSVWISGQLTIHLQLGPLAPLENAMSLAASYSNGFHFGFPIALSIGLFYGGVAFLQHLNLRLLFWSSKQIPWNYTRFLDYAAEHLLLRKVGGGYIFIHRFLLEYFASLDTASSDALRRGRGFQIQRLCVNAPEAILRENEGDCSREQSPSQRST